jgi:hypothetical protein
VGQLRLQGRYRGEQGVGPDAGAIRRGERLRGRDGTSAGEHGDPSAVNVRKPRVTALGLLANLLCIYNDVQFSEVKRDFPELCSYFHFLSCGGSPSGNRPVELLIPRRQGVLPVSGGYS